MNNILRRIPAPVSLLLRRSCRMELPKNLGLSLKCRKSYNTQTLLLSRPFCPLMNGVRNKSKKAQYDSDDEDTFDNDGDSSLSKDSKIVKFSTTSMRTDGILKSAMAISRNKIELMFYESRIRVNGKKILKKSVSVREGDEVDIIKAVSPKNPNHLYISRVEIMSVKPNDDSITVTARRFKSLLIENYEVDPFKGNISENENK